MLRCPGAQHEPNALSRKTRADPRRLQGSAQCRGSEGKSVGYARAFADEESQLRGNGVRLSGADQLGLAVAPGVQIHSRPWVAETCVDALEWRCTKAKARKWRKLILGAKEEIGATLTSDPNHAIEIVQFLAHTDYLLRYPDGFDPDFKPIPEVTAELTALLKVFEAAKGFDAREVCFLNPAFAASRDVGGADADLILDSTLIDFKVVKNMEAAFDYVLQLAGYAVLHGRGGIAIDPPYKKPFSHVGIYFARHGQLVTWKMSDIFQHAGFDKFGKVFWEELPHWKRTTGMMR